MDPALIVAALAALEKALEVAQRIRMAAQQAGEWTPEQEADFRSSLDRITSQDHWKLE